MRKNYQKKTKILNLIQKIKKEKDITAIHSAMDTLKELVVNLNESHPIIIEYGLLDEKSIRFGLQIPENAGWVFP